MMEIVATVDSRKSPVQPRLVLVVPRTVFSQNTLAIGRDDWVDIRAKIRPGVLREDGAVAVVMKNGNRARVLVVLDAEWSGLGSRRSSHANREAKKRGGVFHVQSALVLRTSQKQM